MLRAGKTDGKIWATRLVKGGKTPDPTDPWDVLDRMGVYLLLGRGDRGMFTVEREVSVGKTWGYLEVARSTGKDSEKEARADLGSILAS